MYNLNGPLKYFILVAIVMCTYYEDMCADCQVFVCALWFSMLISFCALAHEHSNAEGVDGMYHYVYAFFI